MIEFVSETQVKRWFPIWLALSITWGFSFVFIKVASEFLDPFQQSFIRISLGLIALALVVTFSHRKFVTDFNAAKHLAFLGIIGQAIPFTLFAWGSHYLSSIASGLVNSMMALYTAMLAILLLPEEKLNRSRLVGLFLGFIGVLILLGIWDENFRGTWFAYLALSMATFCYAISSIYTRKNLSPLKLDPVSAVTTQLFFGLIPVAIIAIFTTSPPTSYPVNGLISIVILGVMGTGFALALNFELIARTGAVVASTVTYSMPIVATFAGVLLLKEKLHWYEPIGAALALLGISLVQGLLKPKFLKTN
jgi:drug/metabolite transporter (DMT)-like permease